VKPVPRPSRRVEVELIVNRETIRRTVDARRLLVDLLREDLDLTATHIGCEHGICGACTVLIDDRPARSCITLAASVDGSAVTTLEGLADDPDMQAMQQSFAAHHGLQCGFCTPGFLMTLAGADRKSDQSEERIRELLSGNLCRCTGYQHIVEAVRDAWGSAGSDAATGVTR
jgi:carbon-monoxide dehydrogenase small subunit